MFPVMFAIGRTSGWIAQWLEMVQDKEQKIARPRQIYTGERTRDLRADREALSAPGRPAAGRRDLRHTHRRAGDRLASRLWTCASPTAAR
jgi:hypothetical protein